MGITPSTFSDGNAITENAVRTELDRVKGWVNGGVVSGDINSAVLAKQHVYRTESWGFPKNNIEGQQQQVVENVNGLNEVTAYPSLQGSSGIVVAIDGVDTRTVFLDHLLEDDAYIIETTRVQLFETSRIEVMASCFAGTTNDNSSAANATAGTLRLVYKEIDGTANDFAGSIRKISVSDEFSALLPAKESCMFEMLGDVQALAAGTYDIWLEYQLGGANTALGQVTIAQPMILIEVFEQ